LTWTLAHKHDSCIIGTLARNRVCPTFVEFTFRAF